MKKITTLILVAGKSTRFKSKKSKIFNEISGLPIINHIILTVKKISNEKDIIFVCNKDNLKILKNKFPNCKFAIQKKQIGTADAVISAKKFINSNSNILILFGDSTLVTNSSLKKLCNKYYHSSGTILAFKTKNPFGYGRVVLDQKKIKDIVEEVNADKETKKINLCNSGIMFCSSKLLFSFINKIRNNNIKKENTFLIFLKFVIKIIKVLIIYYVMRKKC